MIEFRGSGTPRYRFAIIGFPWDFGASLGKPGARYAPDRIREIAHWNLDRIHGDAVWDVEAKRVLDLSELEIVDAGDVEIAAHDRERTLPALTRKSGVLSTKVTYRSSSEAITRSPIRRSRPFAERAKTFGMIQLDAHLNRGRLADAGPLFPEQSDAARP